MISIIVPVYNGENHIEKCINSLLVQTYTDIEIIIVDDGSIDNTCKACEKFIRNDKVHYYKITNHGPAYARNYGLTVSLGDWIMFVDSDDTVNEEICYQLKKAADMYEADLVFCNLKNAYNNIEDNFYPYGKNAVIYNKSEEIKRLEKSLVSKISDTGDSLIALSGPCCKLIKKKITNGIKFPNELSLGEDTCYVLQILSQCNCIVYVPDILYTRNINWGSLSNGCINEHIRLVAFTNWIITYYKDDFSMKKSVNDLIAHNLRKILFDYLGPQSTENYDEAVRYVKMYITQQTKKLTFLDIICLRTEIKGKLILLFAKQGMFRVIWNIYHGHYEKNTTGNFVW